MLERASPCLEPALHNLFRSIEAPTRSQRRLPQAFWRRARVAQEHASWWPAYLDDIRRASKSREGLVDLGAFPHHGAAGALPFPLNQWLKADSATPDLNRNVKYETRRHLSKIVKQFRVRQEKDLHHGLQAKDETTRPVDINVSGPEVIPKPADPRFRGVKKTNTERLQELLRSDGLPRYNEVWSNFLTLGDHAKLARPVLRYLSRSSEPDVLRKAWRIYQTIEVEDRTHLTYESAVRAAVRLRKYRTANQVILEALERGVGQGSSQFLIGHLVENEMWRSAMQTHQVFAQFVNSSVGNESTSNEHVVRNLREAPVWKSVDEMLTLPQKLIALCRRLKAGDPVLALDQAGVEHFATRLLERAFRSPRIMGAITAEGILALLESYGAMGLLRLSHYLDALSALRQLRQTRNRSQLALLVFRHMRWQYPDQHVRDSTYGTMISILSAAPNGPRTFEYILNDVTTATQGSRSATEGRTCDLAMYQRVMAACAEQGYTAYVMQLFHRLIRDHGIPRELAYFTPILLSSAKRGDFKQTKELFTGLSTKYELAPNTHCWNILLLAHARADDFEGAASVFGQMQSSGIIADSYTFGTLMSMYSRAGDTRAVLHLVNLAREQHVPASTAMIDTIVHSYCMNDEVKEAESLVEATTQMALSGSPTRMWNILLRYYAFRGDPSSVLKTQERMRELAVEPDSMTYAALMTSLVVMGKTKEAAAVLRSLHLSQVVTISRFHYSIILHGYVQEGQRDLATVIYAEMLERFGHPSPSARLAMMHLQSQRNELQARRRDADAALEWTGKPRSLSNPLQTHSIDFLADALLEMADSEALSFEPQPGFQRRRPDSAEPTIYLEVAYSMLMRSSSYDKAESLLTHYKATLKASTLSKQQKSLRTIKLLTTQMRGVVRSLEGSGFSREHLQNKSHQQLDALWTQILVQTVARTRERHMELLRSQSGTSSPEVGSRPDSSLSGKEAGAAFPTSRAQKMPSHTVAGLQPADKVVKIIPAERYALSETLSIYMRGLSLQRRLSALESLLQQVQDLGFELTSKNWNTYIQILSQTENTVPLAFRTFEQKLLPNAPPWELLKRGKVMSLAPEHSARNQTEIMENGQTVVPRALIESRFPGQLMPTYTTAIHLAAAFIKSYRMRSKGEEDKMSFYAELRKHAPGTVKLVQEMPYLKDKVQGVLIRRRPVKGDPMKRLREPERATHKGILGSDSQLDGFLPEQMILFEEVKTHEEGTHGSLEDSKQPTRQTALTLMRRRFSERSDASNRGKHGKEASEEALFQSLQKEIQDTRIRSVASDAHGEPHIKGLPSYGHGTLAVTDSDELSLPTSSEKLSLRSNLYQNRVKRLRLLAAQQEHKPQPWTIRSRVTPQRRIIAYPSKQPSKLVKPMGNYVHRDHIFTKPMLTMGAPKRRELGSEHRAFTRFKSNRELKKQRNAEISKAQARRRREQREGGWRQERVVVNEARVPMDNASFLESRLVDRELLARAAISEQVDASRTPAAVAPEALMRDQQAHSARTHLRAQRDTLKVRQETPEPDDQGIYKAKEIDHSMSLPVRLVHLDSTRKEQRRAEKSNLAAYPAVAMIDREPQNSASQGPYQPKDTGHVAFLAKERASVGALRSQKQGLEVKQGTALPSRPPGQAVATEQKRSIPAQSQQSKRADAMEETAVPYSGMPVEGFDEADFLKSDKKSAASGLR